MYFRSMIFLGTVMIAGASYADVTTGIHYRCWDNTLRVSHGGWVSYEHVAEDNCKRAALVYPNNDFWIEEEQY